MDRQRKRDRQIDRQIGTDRYYRERARERESAPKEYIIYRLTDTLTDCLTD